MNNCLETVFGKCIYIYVYGIFYRTLQDGQVQLALLHPMKVSVYALKRVEGTAAHGKSILNIRL